MGILEVNVMDFSFDKDYSKKEILRIVDELYEEESKEIKEMVEKVFGYIWDCIGRNYLPKIDNPKAFVKCSITDVTCLLISVTNVVNEEGFYDLYVYDNTVEFCYNDNKFFNSDEDIIMEIVELFSSFEYAYLSKSKKVKSIAKSCSERFEELYHNTGKTLKQVLVLLEKEGYSDKEISHSIVDVLKDTTWDN